MLPAHERSRLVARPAGYLLRADISEVDLGRFSALADEGQSALEDNDPDRAVLVLGQALALWRGEPVEDLAAGAVLAPMLAALSERRLMAIERHAAARLRIGQVGQVIPDLRELLARHPCREHGWALLMSAQYWSGDAAGALEGFTAARSTLREQLGIEPGEELQQLQHAILNRSLDVPRACTAVSVGAARPARAGRAMARLNPVPRQLPAPPVLVTDCDNQLDDQLTAVASALSTPVGQGRARVVIVHGPPGSGKSALATFAAHQVAPYFPDGQLYADLQSLPAGLPTERCVDQVAESLLRALSDHVSWPDGAAAAARLRSALADRRMLVFLDNVIDPAVVRSLIPAEASCAVLITGCRSLGTVDAATRVAVREPSAETAVRLLLRLAGGAQAAGSPSAASPPADRPQSAATLSAAAQVIQLCGRLPLALRIVAARLASRPDLSMKILARRLQDERTRLDELCFEGLSVRSSLIRCHLQLTGPGAGPGDQAAARLFRLLGQLGARQVSPRLSATLLTEPLAAASRAADRLAEVGLLTSEGPPGRYRVPELTRLFAAEAAGQPLGRTA
jgi:DNA-binding SARP family transcriptional activator